MSSQIKKTSISLPKHIYERLLEISLEQTKKRGKRVSVSQLIIEAIKFYYNLDGEEKKSDENTSSSTE